MTDLFKSGLGVVFVSLLGWIFLPRTSYYGDNLTLYSVETGFCNEHNVCDVKKFFTPITLRVDQQKSEIVWLNPDDGSVGSWKNCTIADKENWSCNQPFEHMVGGILKLDVPNYQNIPGYQYRLYWLVSLLPDLRRQ